MPLAEWQERTKLLVGEEQIERLEQAHILVVGLGGVGGAAAEMLARGLNAHEQILLGNPGEQLVVRQDSFDRASFMPGVLLAVRSVRGRGGLTWGLEALMGL